MLKEIRLDVVLIILLTAAITIFALAQTADFGPFTDLIPAEATEVVEVTEEATIEITEEATVEEEDEVVDAEATEAAES